jgi:DNA replication and repair protein RecF
VYVSDLQLKDFRSYSDVVIRFDPGVSVLVGPNGQGKTNVVEAIGYLATLGSHRVSSEAALVRAGAAEAVIRARVTHGERAVALDVGITPGKANRARINKVPARRIHEILGLVRTVLFAPEDLRLVTGDPDGRRRFLDDLLVQMTPRISGLRTDYDRTLRQRSSLLKTVGVARRSGQTPDLRTLDVWDAHLAHHGAELVAARVALVDRLAPAVAAAYTLVAGAEHHAAVSYKSSLDQVSDAETPDSGNGNLSGVPVEVIEARLLDAMARLRPKEIERGVSLVGPHRDDLVLSLGDLPARGYASHGESWSFALALRLAAFEVLRSETAGDAILILDDVFAELDASRRNALTAAMNKAEQVIVTAAVPSDLPEDLTGARYDVAAGEVTRVR